MPHFLRTKEPETLDWIDTMAEGSALVDVGANVGLYSVYAAKARKCQVYAFEPSVFNLDQGARPTVVVTCVANTSTRNREADDQDLR